MGRSRLGVLRVDVLVGAQQVRRNLQRLALQGVVERLGAGEEVLVAVDDLPARVDAQSAA